MKDAAFVISRTKDKEVEPDWSQLSERQDNDYGIWRNKATETDKHKETINITCPDPRSYADELQKGLVRSDRSINIRVGELEGSDERDSISRLERLFDFLFGRADLYLRNKGLTSLKNSNIWYSMIRGFSSDRILVYLDNGNLVVDMMPLDPRWLTYEYGEDGLSWVTYKTFRTKSELKGTYGSKYGLDKDIAEVYDCWEWNAKKKIATNGVACAGEWLKAPKPYKMRRLPILIVPVGTRPVVTDEEGIRRAGFGDSIYAASRELVPIKNKSLTMWATWANILAHIPLIHETQDGSKEIILFQGRQEAIIDIPPGDKLYALDLPEVSATLVNLVGQIDAMYQRAMGPHIVFGQSSFTQPPSGTAIDLMTEGMDKAYFPYLTNLDSIYTDMCYMIEEQLIDGGLKFEIDGLGKDNRYYKDEITPVDVKRPHLIEVKHTVQSEYGAMQDLQKAQMAKELGIADETWLEKYLKFQDVKSEIALSDFQIVRKDPIMLLISAISLLHDRGRHEEASMLKDLADKLGPQGPIQMPGQPQASPSPTGGATPPQPMVSGLM